MHGVAYKQRASHGACGLLWCRSAARDGHHTAAAAARGHSRGSAGAMASGAGLRVRTVQRTHRRPDQVRPGEVQAAVRRAVRMEELRRGLRRGLGTGPTRAAPQVQVQAHTEVEDKHRGTGG